MKTYPFVILIPKLVMDGDAVWFSQGSVAYQFDQAGREVQNVSWNYNDAIITQPAKLGYLGITSKNRLISKKKGASSVGIVSGGDFFDMALDGGYLYFLTRSDITVMKDDGNENFIEERLIYLLNDDKDIQFSRIFIQGNEIYVFSAMFQCTIVYDKNTHEKLRMIDTCQKEEATPSKNQPSKFYLCGVDWKQNMLFSDITHSELHLVTKIGSRWIVALPFPVLIMDVIIDPVDKALWILSQSSLFKLVGK